MTAAGIGTPSTRACGSNGRRNRSPLPATASTAWRFIRRGPPVLFQQDHCGVYHSDDYGETWHEITEGLPSAFGLRAAGLLAVDNLDPCGLYLSTTGGQVFRSMDAGETWHPAAKHLPRVLSVEVQ